MINAYYLQELRRLREIGSEFSKENPAIAPMLEEPASDPDVERLLEGVAFLTGAVREKLEDEFPEIVHDLLRQIWPQSLRPLPSATMISFYPGEKISHATPILSGMDMASVPVEGTPCRFVTCADVMLHPLSITDVVYEEPGGRHPLIRLTLSLQAGTVATFRPDELSLYLGGRYHEACDLYLRLTRDLKEIRIRAEGEDSYCRLDPSHIVPKGFTQAESLIPWPSNAFEGYRLLQEYFLMPEKFLTLSVKGWQRWGTSKDTTKFYVEFVLNSLDHGLEKPEGNSFVLSTVPAVNIFPHQAVPVYTDHAKTEYPVRPGGESGKYQVYAIEHVEGHVNGRGRPVHFSPFHSFSANGSGHVYHEHLRANSVREGVDVSVSLAYPPGANTLEVKYLSFDVVCTNGCLPEALGEGDITLGSHQTPESVTFENILKPTTAGFPPLGKDGLWQLTSLLTLNHVSLTEKENLKALLKLFLLDRNRDKKNRVICERKIDGIRHVKARPADRLVRGTMMRGTEVTLSMSMSHFAGLGDVFLFGTVLDRFLGMYASINTFTRLIIDESDSGESWSWPERTGEKTLI